MKRLIQRLHNLRRTRIAGSIPIEAFLGHIDKLDASCVAGWACGANHSEVSVEVFLNGVMIGSTPSNRNRPDVEAAGHRRQSGFYFNLSGILNPSENNRLYVRAVGSDGFLRGPSLVAKTFLRESMRRDGFDFSAPLFSANADSYEIDGTSAVVTGQVKSNGAAPTTIRVISGGRFVSATFQELHSNSVLNEFGISVYSYSVSFELSGDPCLQFEFSNPHQADFRPICAIPGPGGLSSFDPSDESRQRVVGTMSPNRYIASAYTSAALLWSFVESEGKEGSWLDWGCGPGRTAIPLKRVFAKSWSIYGCDVDEFNIKVLKRLDKSIPAKVIDLFPPLPYPDNTFDVLHGISVLTHLTEDAQKLWVRELARVLKVHGLALLTTHGELALLMSGFVDEKVVFPAFIRRGISDEFSDGALGPYFKDKTYYRATFQTNAHARALFECHFDVIRCIAGGNNNHQDLWVLRRK